MLAANGLNQKVRTTDAGFSWHKPGVQIPAANGLNSHCICRLQMTFAEATDVGFKWPSEPEVQMSVAEWPEPGMQMPAANGL